jgi:hypothetical protein
MFVRIHKPPAILGYADRRVTQQDWIAGIGASLVRIDSRITTQMFPNSPTGSQYD